MAAVPLTGSHYAQQTEGFLIGGELLNNNDSLVERIAQTLDVASTFFFEDLRVATTILDEDGFRATGTRAARDVAQMVLAGKVNKDLVKLLGRCGGKALGFSGIDGDLITCKKLNSDVDLGYVGEITNVNTEPLKLAIEAGYIPVVASIGTDKDHQDSYNINADTCAAKVAAALKAEKLLLLTDVPGVLMNPKDNSSLISTLRLHEIPKLTLDKVIQGGMLPKISCCVEAVRLGVKKSVIIDGRIPHAILLELLSEKGIGTEIY